MHRNYVEPGNWEDDIIVLGPEEEHHLLDVLRARAGDIVEVFDGKGRSCRAKIEFLTGQYSQQKSPQRILLKIISGSQYESKEKCRITIIQSILKEDHMDLVLIKATELGVSEIFPVLTERVIVQIDRFRREQRRRRWERIAIGAAKQSQCSHIPNIRPITALSEALEHASNWDLFIVGSLQENMRSLRSVLKNVSLSDHVCVLVGPEGDMTKTELQSAVNVGGIPVTFGRQVLRSETASIYALSAIRYELDLM